MKFSEKLWCGVNNRAYTVVEVLVAATLLGILGLLIANQLYSVLRVSARTTVRSAVAQTAAIVAQRLERDLQTSSAAGFSYHEGPVLLLAVHPVIGSDNQGRTLFSQDQLVLYRWDSGERLVERVSWPGTGPADSPDLEPRRFTRLELEFFLADAGAYREAFSGVTSFSVSWPGVDAPNVGSPLTLEVGVTESAVAGREPESTLLNKKVHLRQRF